MKSHEPGKAKKDSSLTDAKDKNNFQAKESDTSFVQNNLQHRTQKHQESIYEAIENEKCKLGQELHDGVNPLLTAALLYLKLIRPVNRQGRKVKETIQTIMMEAIGCIRNLASDLVITEQKQYNLNEVLVQQNSNLIIHYNTMLLLNFKLPINGKKKCATL